MSLDLATVQSWISHPASNQGVILTNPIQDGILRIVSSESATPTQRPKLIVEYVR